ncbi:MAG TPA: histidinol dehydrogenase [Acidimicrobiia bacterium]|nr:histidinol dehydrogenase [Acidimicrobiia bacterium]
MLTRVVLETLTPEERRALTGRSAMPDRAVMEGAAAIVDAVCAGGDAALAEAGREHGGGRREGALVSKDEQRAALAKLPRPVRIALERAIESVTAFHRVQIPADVAVETTPGVVVERRWSPLHRVAAYVPGGLAAYPSTLVMTVVPARLAGVGEIVVASPAGPDGVMAQALLAAASLLEIDELYAMGGAQAVAALAHGTETIRQVGKIVGPGNTWVTAAKLHVLGVCAIDMPAGPSEVCVLADRASDPRLVAVDLLCQAEHGPDSPAVLVTADPGLADRVDAEIERLLALLDRSEILERAISDHGMAVIAADHHQAVAFAEEYAGEHITILTTDPETDSKAITSAGSVYVGRWSPESAGDYATGANHVLPTGGLAAAYGPLSVEDFGSWRQVQTLTEAGLRRLWPTIAVLADAEGLTAHRLAAELRFEDKS